MSFKKAAFAILKVGIALAIVLSMAIPVMAGAITSIAVTPVDDTAGATTDYSITFTPATGEAANVTVDFSTFGITGTDMDLTGVSTNINDYSFTGFSVNATGVSVNNTTKIMEFTGGNTTTGIHTITNKISGTGLRITNDQDAETQNVTISTLSDSGIFALTINPGAIDHYSVSAISSPQVASVPFGVTIQAQDFYNNDITTGADASENITITFGKTDASATPTSNTTASGTAIMNMTMTVSQSDQNIIFTGDTSTKIGTSDNFTVTEPASAGGGGGISPPPDTSWVYEDVTTGGEFTKDVTVESDDGNVELAIDEGTIGLTKKGKKLMAISIAEMEDPPDPPKESNRIGLTYDLGPDGATFDPPITLTFTYDPDELPEGVNEENLVVAVWDEDAGEWVDLVCTVDPETNTIMASVDHFTAFAGIAYTHPATFETSYLTILPREVDPDEKVTSGVKVANTGDLSGSYEVTLKIDGVAVATKDVTLAGGASQKVAFTTSKDVAGTYNVNVNGLSGTFTVRPAPAVAPAPPVAPPAPPAPAPVEEGGVNWYIIGTVFGIVSLIAIFLPIWIRKRRAG